MRRVTLGFALLFACDRPPPPRVPGTRSSTSCPPSDVTQSSRGWQWTCTVDTQGRGRCVRGEEVFELADGPPIRQLDVSSARNRTVICALDDDGVWCTPDDDLAAPRQTWRRIRNSSGAVMVAGSCLLKANGTVHCWTSDEASWMGVTGASDIVANLHVDNDETGCIKSLNLVCVSYGGRRDVRCTATFFDPRWETIEGTEGATDLASMGDAVCAVLPEGHVTCWDVTNPVATHVPELDGVVGLDSGQHAIWAWDEGCERRSLWRGVEGIEVQ